MMQPNSLLKNEESLKAPSERSFGFVFTVVFTLLGLLPLIKGGSANVTLLSLAGVICCLSLFIPSTLSFPNRVWFKFGLLLHRLMSPIVLGFVFFAVVTPIALVMRVWGWDSLRLKKRTDRTTYWRQRDPVGPSAESLSQQF